MIEEAILTKLDTVAVTASQGDLETTNSVTSTYYFSRISPNTLMKETKHVPPQDQVATLFVSQYAALANCVYGAYPAKVEAGTLVTSSSLPSTTMVAFVSTIDDGLLKIVEGLGATAPGPVDELGMTAPQAVERPESKAAWMKNEETMLTGCSNRAPKDRGGRP